MSLINVYNLKKYMCASGRQRKGREK